MGHSSGGDHAVDVRSTHPPTHPPFTFLLFPIKRDVLRRLPVALAVFLGTGSAGLLPSTRTSGDGSPLGWSTCTPCTSSRRCQHRAMFCPTGCRPQPRAAPTRAVGVLDVCSCPPLLTHGPLRHASCTPHSAQVPKGLVFQPKPCGVGSGQHHVRGVTVPNGIHGG